MNKNILLITSPFRPNIGGVETHLDDLIQEVTKHKINITVLTYQPLITKATGKFIEKSDYLQVYRLPWPRFGLFLKLEKYPILEFLYLFPGLFLGSLLILLFKSKEISIIHSQGLVAGAVGVFLGKLFSKKVIISTHSIYGFPKNSYYSKFVKFLFGYSDHVLTLSQQSRKEIVKLGIKKEKVSVFTYWVNQNIFKPTSKANARKIVKIGKKKFVCLFAGRLVEVKGIRELLNAASKLPKISFLIIGDGPLSTDVKKYAKKYRNIIFVGPVANKKLPVYYNASDLLIIPSTHEEGFGRVILEALSCGVPIVGSNRGAIPEAITKDVGVLIDISVESIVKVLTSLKKNKTKVYNMTKNSRKYAVEKYSNKNAMQILKYYEV